MSKKRQCKLCQKLATNHGYCEMHKSVGEHTKPDSKQRSGKTWRTRQARRWRQQYLANHPYCLDHMTIFGEAVPATQVHHVIEQELAPDRVMDASNCVALCEACHYARHGRGYGGAKLSYA